MFSGLRSLEKQRDTLSPDDITRLRGRQSALQTALRYTTARCALVADSDRMKHTMHDFSDLRRLNRVIREHGISSP